MVERGKIRVVRFFQTAGIPHLAKCVSSGFRKLFQHVIILDDRKVPGLQVSRGRGINGGFQNPVEVAFSNLGGFVGSDASAGQHGVDRLIHEKSP